MFELSVLAESTQLRSCEQTTRHYLLTENLIANRMIATGLTSNHVLTLNLTLRPQSQAIAPFEPLRSCLKG